MEKTIIIRITNPTKAQDALLQRLVRAFRAEHIEVQENTAFTLLSGNLQIDPQRRLVWQSDQTVDLTPMEFDILLLLARRPGQVFTARQIYEAVAADSLTPAGRGSLAWSISSAASWGRDHRDGTGPRATNSLPRHLTKIKQAHNGFSSAARFFYSSRR